MLRCAEVGKALDSLVDAVRARYESGTAIQADIVRAALQRSEVDHQILTTTGVRRMAAARLLPLLGLPLTTEVPALHLAHSTEARSITAAREIAEDQPALAALSADVQRREQEIRLAELLRHPDFNVEASYGMRPQLTDVVSVVARIELPLRKKTAIEPRVREANRRAGCGDRTHPGAATRAARRSWRRVRGSCGGDEADRVPRTNARPAV
ncbi:MAG TPA: hypothetical protein VEK79_14380 [Thermoanaerobaculia bacterium]|nr:hypothetical protein [Thermoanaerobaculia bacterium]